MTIIRKKCCFDCLEEVGKEIKSVLKNDGSFFLNISGRPYDPALPFDLAVRLTKNVDFNYKTRFTG